MRRPQQNNAINKNWRQRLVHDNNYDKQPLTTLQMMQNRNDRKTAGQQKCAQAKKPAGRQPTNATYRLDQP